MLDLKTKVWTDKEGNETHLSKLEDTHLLNIQRFLKRRLKNKGRIENSVFMVAYAYDSCYSDKDWYMPGSAFDDVPEMVDDMMARNKIALMLVSQEVKRREPKPFGGEG